MEALSKAGLLDRVMEVVHEADEDETSQSGGSSRRASLVPVPMSTERASIQQPSLMVTSATLPDLASKSSDTNGDVPEKKSVRKYQSLQQLQSEGGYTPSLTNEPETDLYAIINSQPPDLKAAVVQAQTPPVETRLASETASDPYGGMSVQDIINLSRGEPTTEWMSARRKVQTKSDLPSQMRFVDNTEASDELPTSLMQDDIGTKAPNPSSSSARAPRPKFTDGLPSSERPMGSISTDRDAFFTPEDELTSNPLGEKTRTEVNGEEAQNSHQDVANGPTSDTTTALPSGPTFPPLIPPRSEARGTPPMSKQSSGTFAPTGALEQPRAPLTSHFEETGRHAKAEEQAVSAPYSSNGDVHATIGSQARGPQLLHTQVNGHASGLAVSGIPLPPLNQHRRSPSGADSSTTSSFSGTMPGTNGYEAAQSISQLSPSTPERIARTGPPLRIDSSGRRSIESAPQSPIQSSHQTPISALEDNPPIIQLQSLPNGVEGSNMHAVTEPTDMKPDPGHTSPYKTNAMSIVVPEDAPQGQKGQVDMSSLAGSNDMTNNGPAVPTVNGVDGESSAGTNQNVKSIGMVKSQTNRKTMRALTLTSKPAQNLNRSFFRNNANTPLRQTPSQLSRQRPTTALIATSNVATYPQEVGPDECLVQVLTSAIDFWDRAKVEILTSRGQEYGFIPGRAFVGRIIQGGNSLDPVEVKTGDLVYGLNDLKKVSLDADSQI